MPEIPLSILTLVCTDNASNMLVGFKILDVEHGILTNTLQQTVYDARILGLQKFLTHLQKPKAVTHFYHSALTTQLFLEKYGDSSLRKLVQEIQTR